MEIREDYIIVNVDKPLSERHTDMVKVMALLIKMAIENKKDEEYLTFGIGIALKGMTLGRKEKHGQDYSI